MSGTFLANLHKFTEPRFWSMSSHSGSVAPVPNVPKPEGSVGTSAGGGWEVGMNAGAGAAP